MANSNPEAIRPVELRISARDARRCANELATAIDFYKELIGEGGKDVEINRTMVESMTRVGDELDRIARLGGLRLSRSWMEVRRGG